MHRFRLVPRADVNPEFVDFAHAGVLLLLRPQVRRLTPDDAGDPALRPHEQDALAGQELPVDAADKGEEEEAAVIDILHQEAVFVAVRVDHHPERRAWVFHGMEVAEGVEADFVGEAFDVFCHKALALDFAAAWGLRLAQGAEKV